MQKPSQSSKKYSGRAGTVTDMAEYERLLNGSHYCDHGNQPAAHGMQHPHEGCECPCAVCFSFWHWNIWEWEKAKKWQRAEGT